MLRLWVLWSIFGGIVLILLRQKLMERRVVKNLKELKEAIMATEQELDEALEAVGSGVAAIKDSNAALAGKVTELAVQVTKLIEKINNGGSGIDLTDELAAATALKTGLEEAAAQVTASNTKLDEAIASAKLITEPPAPPAA